VLTGLLFEQWGVDTGWVAGIARDAVGPWDFFLGGSLADDLGSVTSDIDVYCFTRGVPAGRRTVSGGAGRPVVELHVVDVAPETRTSDSLVPLVTSAVPLPPAEWPVLTGTAFRALHALQRDRVLSIEDGAAEAMRAALGADILPLYVALRASVAAVALLGEAASRPAAESPWHALYRARAGVESAVDAALAAGGTVCPNPKLRLTLARRAGLLAEDGGPVTPESLFPDPRAARDSLVACARTASALLTIVREDAYMARFPAIATAADDVDDAYPGVRV
jgi:hypothetical protein